LSFIRSISLATVASVALAACGGGHGSVTPNPSGATVPSQQQRHAQSICTPDSYGYCMVQKSQRGRSVNCGGYQGVTITTVYDVYTSGTTFFGEYTETNESCTSNDYWTPESPGDATGDPNLP